MTADVHTLAGAYALHALPADEQAFFERHLSVCATCRTDVDAFTETVARLGMVARCEPPPGLRHQVLQRVAAVGHDAGAPGPATPAPARSRPRTQTLLAAVAGVLALALLVLSGVAVQMNQRMAELEAALPSLDDRALAVLTAPDAQTRLLEAGSDATARFVYSTELDRGIFVAHGLDQLPPDRTYELWLFHDGTPHPATVFDGDAQGRALTVVEGLVAGAEFAAVTVEPDGGSPRPTGDILIHGPV